MKKNYIIIFLCLVVIIAIIVLSWLFTIRTIDVEFLNDVENTSKEEIISLANIKNNTNIFVIDEATIERQIESGFSDSSINVTTIERSFPNIVIIKVKERVPLFKIQRNINNSIQYVTPDIDFRRPTTYKENELPEIPLIEVLNLQLTDTYNTKECICLRNIALGLIELGFTENSIISFIKSIEFSGNTVKINLRTTDTSLLINWNDVNIKSEIKRLINRYFNEVDDFTEWTGVTII
ncbi:MAG: FtsQ-type POTRA domain-containing protein [Clostridia bacterium]|nr:FtsQ-type POTRA domain-containing protein [Clostridia bacterium]